VTHSLLLWLDNKNNGREEKKKDFTSLRSSWVTPTQQLTEKKNSTEKIRKKRNEAAIDESRSRQNNNNKNATR
jgi:hypothetical protein